MGVVFIKNLPDVVLDDFGAELSYISGGEEYRRQYPMRLWRLFIERETRRLLAYDDAERKRVVPFPKGSQRGH
jgi:hypothetical protein